MVAPRPMILWKAMVLLGLKRTQAGPAKLSWKGPAQKVGVSASEPSCLTICKVETTAVTIHAWFELNNASEYRCEDMMNSNGCS